MSKREWEDERPVETPVTVIDLQATSLYSVFSCLIPRNSDFLAAPSPQISEFGGRQICFPAPKLWTRFTPLTFENKCHTVFTGRMFFLWPTNSVKNLHDLQTHSSLLVKHVSKRSGQLLMQVHACAHVLCQRQKANQRHFLLPFAAFLLTSTPDTCAACDDTASAMLLRVAVTM